MSKPKLRIPNWTSFQHYKNRMPPWIKLHRALLNNRHWHELSDAASKLLIELWLIAAESDDGTISLATDDLAWRQRRSSRTLADLLIELESHEFLDLSVHDARTVIGGFSTGPVILASAEGETEKKSETEQRQRQNGATTDFEKLVAYMGEEARAMAEAVAEMPGIPPTWAKGVLATYGPGPKLDKQIDRIPESERPSVLALAMARYATDATDWKGPFFKSFVIKAHMDRAKGDAEDKALEATVQRHVKLVPLIEERRVPAKPLDGDAQDLVNQLTQKFRMPSA